MVDLVGSALVQFAQRIVGQFSEMHDGVEPFDVLWTYAAHVLGQGERARVVIVVEPAVAIESAICPDNIEPLFQKPGPEHGADIPVGTGDQYPHHRHLSPLKKGLPSNIAKIGLANRNPVEPALQFS